MVQLCQVDKAAVLLFVLFCSVCVYLFHGGENMKKEVSIFGVCCPVSGCTVPVLLPRSRFYRKRMNFLEELMFIPSNTILTPFF